MSILTGPEIERVVRLTRGWIDPDAKKNHTPQIEIEAFDSARLGPNSYDVSLGASLRTYRRRGVDYDTTWRKKGERGKPLDSRKETPTDVHPIHSTGFELEPGRLYLGFVAERIRCEGLVPYVDGRSSFGRLGLCVHQTAGRGDDGWDGRLTLELTVVEPLVVYAGDLVAQVTFHTVEGERRPYRGRYLHSDGPVASRSYLPRPG